MTRPSILSVTWIYFKQYAAIVIAAWLMYKGIAQIISMASNYAGYGITKFINWIILRGFRDRMPLPELGFVLPWQFQTRILGAGAIIFVMGFIVAFLVNVKISSTKTGNS